jgi:dipeptidyl aminopeptidase/acylaminoacyl peptidase
MSAAIDDNDDDASAFEDLGARKLITPVDLQRVTTVGDVSVSACGKWVAFVRGAVSDEATLRKARSIWLVASDGTHLKQLTAGADDAAPTWSPDAAAVAFVRGGQIWTIAVGGGEAVQLSNFAVGVEHLRWGAGNTLAFTTAVRLDDQSFTDTAEHDRASTALKWRVYDELPVRSWDRYVSEKRSHLFVAPIEATRTHGYRLAAPPRDLMSGVDADCPTHHTFDGREQIAFSPDGKRVAFACKYRTLDAAWSVSTVLHIASLSGDDTDSCASHSFVSSLTLESHAIDNFPAFSPDGQHLAWLSSLRPGDEADKLELMVHRIGSTTAQRVRLQSHDVSIGEFVWTSPKSIAFAADYHAQRALFAIDDVFAATPAARIVHGDGSVSSLAFAGGHKVVATLSSFVAAAELVAIDVGSKHVTPLTTLNKALMASLDLAVPRSLTVVGHNGTPVQAWVVVPSRTAMRRRAESGKPKKMPVLLLIHGGPQGAWANDWHARWNVQVFAALGFVVVVPNFTGSTGFGQAYVDAIANAWDVAVKDCLLALDHVLEQFASFCDETSQFVMGASFGGWATLYLNGTTNRFVASVAHDGVFDTRSFYYQTDELFFVEASWGRPGGSDESKFRLFSPSAFVERWQTPVLLMHGGLDFRCPLGESLAAFQAARRRGVKARICINDDANHWVTNPTAAVQWHAHIRDWLAEFNGELLEWKN